MAGTICTSDYFGAQLACDVTSYIDDFVDNATTAAADVQTAIEDLVDSFSDNVSTPSYAPSYTVQTFTSPTENPQRGSYTGLEPDPVTLPARSSLISSADLDLVFARARSRIARTQNASIRAALEQTGSMGIGLPSPAIERRLAEAIQKQAEAISSAALEQGSQEGVWEREDIKTVAQMELDYFTKQWEVTQGRLNAEEETLRSKIQNYQAQLAKELEKRGWNQMAIEAELKKAADGANVAVQWGQVSINKLMAVEEMIIKMKAAVFQAWITAANLSMSASSSYSASESTSL